MKLKWRKTILPSWQLWWDDRLIRCAELNQRDTGRRWRLILSYHVAPMDLAYTAMHSNLEEAKEYAENLVRILIIGGHYERN